MTLTELFTNIANAIRDKSHSTDKIKATEFADKISAIPGCVLLDSSEHNTTSSFTISADLTNYCGVIIFSRGRYNSGKATGISFIPKGETGRIVSAGHDDNKNFQWYGRGVTCTATGIKFDSISIAQDGVVLRVYGVPIGDSVNGYYTTSW